MKQQNTCKTLKKDNLSLLFKWDYTCVCVCAHELKNCEKKVLTTKKEIGIV